jgi:hypothetical protein
VFSPIRRDETDVLRWTIPGREDLTQRSPQQLYGHIDAVKVIRHVQDIEDDWRWGAD